MKNITKKMLSLIIIVSILLSSVFAITAFADEETVYSSSADKYFSELKINIPSNEEGSCGYVAMCMLLAYYDTYWNDNFVGSQYDYSATYTSSALENGYSTIRTENIVYDNERSLYMATGGTMSEREYYIDFVNRHQNEGYLHLDLIGLGIDQGYYDGLISRDEYGVTLYEIGLIFDIYFDDIFGDKIYFDPNGYFNSPNDQLPLKIKYMSMRDGDSYDDIIDKMADIVSEGTPVIYFGSRYADEYTGDELFPEKEGHFVIPYDVVRENEEVVDFVVHTGWRNREKYSQYLSDLPYELNIGILWFEIDENLIPHSCSNNYVLTTGEGACSCEIHCSLHPNHVHENTGTLLSTDSTKHVYECVWGGEISDYHVLTYRQHSSSQHYETCTICGSEYMDFHTMVMKTTRYSECTGCGYTRDEWGPGGNVIMDTEDGEETE